MKLKTLAALVCIAQATQLGLGLYSSISRRSITGLYTLQLLCMIPMILFFFYVYKRQKENE